MTEHQSVDRLAVARFANNGATIAVTTTVIQRIKCTGCPQSNEFTVKHEGNSPTRECDGWGTRRKTDCWKPRGWQIKLKSVRVRDISGQRIA